MSYSPDETDTEEECGETEMERSLFMDQHIDRIRLQSLNIFTHHFDWMNG